MFNASVARHTPTSAISGSRSRLRSNTALRAAVQPCVERLEGRTLLSAAVEFQATEQNRPPVAVADAATTIHGTPVAISVLDNDSDPDGDALCVIGTSWLSVHAGTVTNLGNGILSYTTPASYFGPDTFKYTISDGRGGGDTAGVSISVLAPAQITFDPATEWNISSNPNGVWSYGWSKVFGSAFILSTGVATNVQQSHTWQYSGNFGTGPSVGHNETAATVVVGSVIWPPDGILLHPGANGEVSILRFTAPSDGTFAVSGNFTSQDLKVGATTDVHVLHNGASVFDGVIGSEAYVKFSKTFAGAEGDTIDFAVGFGNGSFSFDSTGLDATISMSTNQPPAATNDPATTVAGNPVTIAVLHNDIDDDGDELAVIAVTQPENGTVIINPDNTATYTPNGFFSGPDAFTYTIDDGRGGQDTATVTVSVLAPAQVIENVIAEIDALDGTALSHGDATSLIAKLNTAITQLDHENATQAVHLLEVFLDRTGILPQPERQQIIDDILAVIESLGQSG